MRCTLLTGHSAQVLKMGVIRVVSVCKRRLVHSVVAAIAALNKYVPLLKVL